MEGLGRVSGRTFPARTLSLFVIAVVQEFHQLRTENFEVDQLIEFAH